MPDRGSRLLAAAGLVLAAAGGIWWQQSGAEPPDGAGTGPSPAPRAVVATVPPVQQQASGGGVPQRITIPALGVDAPVVAVRAPHRTLMPPADPTELGWWADGAMPGAQRGSALITGHTVHTGGGALDDLEDLRHGDALTVRTARGPLAYVVQQVRVYSKGRIAADAERLFDQRRRGRLVLITCEDWDGERYLANVVVTARPRS